MLSLGITPKKKNQNENQSLLILNSKKIEEQPKKFHKNIKNKTAFIISKKMNLFLKRIKSKRGNKSKVTNNDNLLKKGIKANDYRNFLYYKLSKKYNSKNFSYNIKKINELIFNIPSKFTASFKDFLLEEEDAEFLKREYQKKEFRKKFKKIFYFYEKYSKIFPNYAILSEGKYMYRNILKKQKMIDELQKMKEEEEEKTNSKIMDISSETIFTNKAIDSIVNQKDSFLIQNLEDIIYLDKQDEIDNIQNINIIIENINQAEILSKKNIDKKTKYEKQYKKIRNLSKPLHINQINPKLLQIKERINQIKNLRNNYDKYSKYYRTIESSYNSFSTTINNKSYNNKGNTISNRIKTNLYEEMKEFYTKRMLYLKKLSYEKYNKERLSYLSNKFKNNSNDKNLYDAKISNSMITNKIKKYFERNKSNYDKKKEDINTRRKSENSYNVGSLFNSRKDKCKEFQNDKKLISVFNKYINNRTKPFKKKTSLNTEITISQKSISNNKNDLMILNQNNLYPNLYSTEIYDSKRFFEDNLNKSKKKNNYSLNKNNINININISQNSFLNHTFSSNIKYNKKDLNLNKNNSKNKKLKKNLENFTNNKLFFKTKILKNTKNKSNTKSIILPNDNHKNKNINFGGKSHLKTITNIRNTDFSINNTKASIGKSKSGKIVTLCPGFIKS